MKKRWRWLASLFALAVVLLGATLIVSAGTPASASTSAAANGADGRFTTTPIKHLVVIFDENISFDHYFGTYPYATNPAEEPAFYPKAGTPTVNGLTPALLNDNPNSVNPFRLDRAQALTCDQDHGYSDEQKAYDNGLADKFVQYTLGSSCKGQPLVMGYFDGNTVTALWNYAQNFSMSDNSYNTVFGPSTPGALNLISGQTHGAVATTPALAPVANGTLFSDADPLYDDCSTTNGNTVAMIGKNVGDLLNTQNLTWGWFEGGFRPTSTTSAGTAVCGSTHTNIGGAVVTDYIPHHEPFQYYQSTSNPHHLAPSSPALIGKTDQANHQYDLTDFWTAVSQNNLPAVSFLKAAAYQDGHAGTSYSDPLDEQTFLVNTINQLEKSPEWKNTAVIVSYDDSDGWYDHVAPPILSQSNTAQDFLSGAGSCGTTKAGAYEDRCGYGPRLPLLVISPYAKQNFVDNTLTDQSSILRFIEDNWKTGRIGDQSFDALAGSLDNMFDFHRPSAGSLFLSPSTGEPVHR